MKRFEWTLHNLVGHPFMELFHVLGLREIGDYIHDITLPARIRRKLGEDNE